ncbi:hypothetical protein SAMN05216218_112116 [Halorientalis regularis]|uniref:Uncharacterized protein n=1 Tax=Halorientalis regularis TaxID=660518 RepID=A0A1G7QF27_9EURY|nr:hypothetical protein SAMN05216218_112116 [Halorientalis regularis]
MVRAVSGPFPDLNELERVEGSRNLFAELCLGRWWETIDGNRGECVLSEKVAGSETRRGNNNDILAVNIGKFQLGIPMLEYLSIKIIDREQLGSVPVVDARRRRLKMLFGH